MAQPVIEVKGLHTRRGGQTILRDIDLRVDAGEILGLVGGSGSGKTTLLREIIGLDAPAGGAVKLFGIDTFNAKRAHRLSGQRRFG